MNLIIYSSQLTSSDEPIEEILAGIIKTAKKKNPKIGVTGLLFYHKTQFLQIIEGEVENLEGLMTIISKDSRHCGIDVLVNEKILDRSFENWNMDTFNLGSNQKIDPTELRKIILAYQKVAKLDSETLITFLKLLLSQDI